MQRRQRLTVMVSRVVADGSVDAAALAEEFAVSVATVRRDLEVLERRRLVSRTRGGATTHSSFHDLPLEFKTAQDSEQKHRIAARALEHLDGARVVGMTGGTTVAELARLVLDRDGLTVVTSALNVATELLANPRLRVLAAGGEVRSSSHEAVGPRAEAFVSEYNLDVAFAGVDGVDAAAGCTTYDPAGARVNGALLTRARRRIVLADASKVGRVALARVCAMPEVDVLITDGRLAEADADAIRETGCTVDIA